MADATTLTRGHKKKARTRRQLLDAALVVLAEQGESFSIGDLAAHAGVAHGTFYNYFEDREALIEALVTDVVAGFAERAAAEVDEGDPAVRFAVITARALAAATAQPELVSVAFRIPSVQRALVEGGFSHLRADLAAGHRSGRFAERPDDALLDVIVGALLAAARRVVDGEIRPAYRRSVIRRLLVLLGVESDEATAIARAAVAAAS